ncbi:MAG: recombination protein RecR [Firmicutes bacterium]|nr:recombination protein RecR [Bacillota bacterium]
MYPESILNLIESFKKLPGIGEKSAERLAFSIIDFDDDDVEMFSKSLLSVKNNIKNCTKCNHITENEICDLCADNTRDKKTLCVVEDSKSVIMFEKLSVYNGLYFVLDGLISPLDKIGPDDINLDKLLEKIKNENIGEVILAIKPTIEGETTSLYILKLLEEYNSTSQNENVAVSRIAHGIPLGVDMEYIDSLTLELALQDRKKIS